MNQANQYVTFDDAVVAAQAPVDARVAFLRRTYGFLLAAIAMFAGTLYWAGIHGSPVQQLAIGMWNTSPWLVIILLFASNIAVHALAETVLGAPLLFALAILDGILLTPLILYVASTQPHIITQASLITAIVFTGLTAYVFKSGKDFGFLGGILWIVFFGMFAVAIVGMFSDFGIGIWYSYLGAALFAGFILYDTSNILHRFPTTAHISAAAVLFVDVVIMFKYIVMILMNRD